MGAYDEAYRRSLDDPEGFWRDAATAIDWIEPFDRVIDRSIEPAVPLVHRRRAEHVRQRRRPPRRRRARPTSRPSSTTPRSPATVRTLTYRGLRDEVARFAGALRRAGRGARATPSSSTCRWCPRPSIAMLACARLGAVHSVVFGGFAPERAGGAHRRRPAQGDRVGVVRHRGASASSSTSRCSTSPSRPPPTSPTPASCCSVTAPRPAARRCRRRDGRRARPRLGRARRRRRRPPDASPWPPPTRSTSSTRRARRGSRRASCATTAATPWPCGGACRTSTTPTRARCSGRRRDVGWVVGHSYIVYAPLLTGLHDDPLRGQAGRHARPGRVLAGRRPSTA